MKAIHIYHKQSANYDVEIVLNPFAIALPFAFRKWTTAAQFQFLFFTITIDWLPLPF